MKESWTKSHSSDVLRGELKYTGWDVSFTVERGEEGNWVSTCLFTHRKQPSLTLGPFLMPRDTWKTGEAHTLQWCLNLFYSKGT